jgi:hypothetical protein
MVSLRFENVRLLENTLTPPSAQRRRRASVPDQIAGMTTDRSRECAQSENSYSLLASFVLISGLSYRTTFNKELLISSFPLYSM